MSNQIHLGDTDGDIPTEKKALCIYRYPTGEIDGDTEQLIPFGPPMSEERNKEFHQELLNAATELARYYSEDYVDKLIDEEFISES